MAGLVKVVISARQSGYIAMEDLRRFLINTFGDNIDFRLKVGDVSVNPWRIIG